LQNSESTLSLDARVRDHIVHLTNSGLRNLSEMQRQLQQFVDLQLFVNDAVPSAVDARFRPNNCTVLNTMYRTVSKTRYLHLYDFLYLNAQFVFIEEIVQAVKIEECLFTDFLFLCFEDRLQ